MSSSKNTSPPDDAVPGSAIGPRRLPLPVRWLLLAFAVLCVMLGVIGIFVPGMPTTVFILMAAWASMRSSPRLDAWLRRHPRFGPTLRNWEDGGKVSRRVKWMATGTMSLSAAVLLALARPLHWPAGLALGCMAAVLGWLWCRPE